MRILEVTAAPYGSRHSGGGERHVEGLVRALRSQVEVLTAHVCDPSEPQPCRADLRLDGTARSLPPFLSLTNPIPSFHTARQIDRFLDSQGRDLDLVHVHNLRTIVATEWLILNRLRRARCPAPVVLTDHGARSFPFPRFSARLVDYYAPVSLWSEEILQKWARHPSRVIPTGVGDEFLAEPPLALEERTIDLLFLGRFLAVKRPDALLPLAQELFRASSRRVRVVIAGRPFDASYFRRLTRAVEDANRAGVQAELIVNPDDARLRSLYRSSRVHLLLSAQRDSEGRYYRSPELAPISVLEAAACGTPTVAARTPGLSEQVADGETGYVVDPFDVPAQVAAVDRLLGDPALWRRFSAAARKRMIERHTYTVLARQFLEYARWIRSRAT